MSADDHRQVIHRGRRFDFELVVERLPDGLEAVREVVRHPGAVVVLGVTDDGRIPLIRNRRIAVGEWVWELPAGTLEPPEPPEVCASRELEEEAGFSADGVEPLGAFYTTPGMTDELMRAYLATGLRPTRQRLEDDERIEVHLTPVQEVMDMIDRGELRDAKSILAILLALRRGKITTAAP